MADPLPTDLADTDSLPDVYSTAREGFGFEWYEHCAADDTRSVVVYRFTLGGRLSWSTGTAARPGETLASLTRRAADTRTA